jgi:hypothetical protein
MERAERKLPGVCVCGGVWAGGGSRGHLDPGLSRVTRGDSYFKVYSAELMNSYELELRDKGQQAMRVDEGSSAPPPPTPPPGPPILVLVGCAGLALCSLLCFQPTPQRWCLLGAADWGAIGRARRDLGRWESGMASLKR